MHSGLEWKKFFKEHGVTHVTISKKVGYSVPTVTQILNEYRSMPNNVLRAFQQIK
jgi:CRP-like cAMP-binding protein